MSQYNNNEGWEASPKTRNYWRFIPMQSIKLHGFEMPPLFKEVNPIIKWMIIGFFGLIVLELYATFAVAMDEGVPIEIIAILLFVDIFLAVLPHIFDGKRTDLSNFIFIGQYSKQILILENYEKEMYEASYIHHQNKLKTYNLFRIILCIPIIISAIIKLYLFFSQYPFYNTYQAYIIIISYSLGCVLHLICTGNVIMYWRFKLSLNKDRNEFGKTNGVTNRINARPNKLINIPVEIQLNIPHNNLINQKVILPEDKFYLHFEGLLFDEEINDLIAHQDSLKQKLAIALTGKIIQTSILDGGDNAGNK